jgi:hypothetical protein
MSDYVKATNFAAKDSLPVGDANKKVKGTEIDNEFNLISDSMATKADLNSPALTGTPSAPTASVGTNTTQLATTAFVKAAVVPAGAVFYFAMSSTPTGYLVCDGSAVSRTTYSELFAAVGTTFGTGDGSTTFNLPDLVGQFIRGYNADASVGVDAGRTFGSQQDDSVTDHYHYMASEVIPTGFTDLGDSEYHAGLEIVDRVSVGDGTGDGTGIESSNTGERSNFGVDKVAGFTADASTVSTTETRPTNVALLACIKY